MTGSAWFRFASDKPMRIVSFIDKHPALSIFLVSIFAAKSVISILTPLSADFMLLGPISSSQGIAWVLGTGNPAVLWILVMMGIHNVWLLLPIDHTSLTLMMGLWYFTPSFSSFLLVFMYKLPLIVIDFVSAFLLYRIAISLGVDYRGATAATVLWLANPYVTLTSEMWGGYDIVAQFFVLASILLLMKNRTITAALALAIGVGFKLYPLILLPAFLLFLLKQRRQAFRRFLGATAFSILLMTSAVFFVVGGGSHLRALARYFLDQSGFFTLSAFETYLPAYVALGLTVAATTFYLLLSYRLRASSKEFLVDSVFGQLLILFALSYWHPQYLVWILPFVTLDYVLHRPRPLYPILLIGSAFSYVLIRFGYYFSSYQTTVFFVPNYDNQLQAISNMIYALFESNWNGPEVVLLRGLFLGICVLYVVKQFQRTSL